MRKGFKVSTVAEREFGREESLSGRRLGLGLGGRRRAQSGCDGSQRDQSGDRVEH